jgi:hypothetical protein
MPWLALALAADLTMGDLAPGLAASSTAPPISHLLAGCDLPTDGAATPPLAGSWTRLGLYSGTTLTVELRGPGTTIGRGGALILDAVSPLPKDVARLHPALVVFVPAHGTPVYGAHIDANRPNDVAQGTLSLSTLTALGGVSSVFDDHDLLLAVEAGTPVDRVRDVLGWMGGPKERCAFVRVREAATDVEPDRRHRRR